MAVTHADICIGNELENSFEMPKHIIILKKNRKTNERQLI
jgi:hypothetical protein